jgi:hypothetical protein
MAEIVNLRQARKQMARTDKDAAAAQNRAAFGRTKAEKQKSSTEKTIAEKLIDAHKRDR